MDQPAAGGVLATPIKSSKAVPSTFPFHKLRAYVELECAKSTAAEDPLGYANHDDEDDQDGGSHDHDGDHDDTDSFIVAESDHSKTHNQCENTKGDSLSFWCRIRKLNQAEQVAKERRRQALADKRRPLHECIVAGAALHEDPIKAIRQFVTMDENKLDEVIRCLYGRSAPYSNTSVERIAKRLQSRSKDPFTAVPPTDTQSGAGTTKWLAGYPCRHGVIVRAANVLNEELQAKRTDPVSDKVGVYLLRLSASPQKSDSETNTLLRFKASLYKVLRYTVLVLNQLANGP